MKVSAHVQNGGGQHRVTLRTEDRVHHLTIAPKPTGFGSSVSGAELLFLALATCYCNDLYREAQKRDLEVEGVEVEVEGEFGAEGEPTKSVAYHVKVTSAADEGELQRLLQHTDRVAEIQNTLRVETPVSLGTSEVVKV